MYMYRSEYVPITHGILYKMSFDKEEDFILRL